MHLRSLLGAAVVLLCLVLVAGTADAKPRRHHHARPVAAEPVHAFFGGGDLVSRARAYMGSNPTGWARLWCGRFMAMIAPGAAARVKNPNLARSWATLTRTSGRVGDIAVLSRGRRGGHVGVVAGFTARGDVMLVSGNHNRRVGEGVYSRSRVIAFVSPS